MRVGTSGLLSWRVSIIECKFNKNKQYIIACAALFLYRSLLRLPNFHGAHDIIYNIMDRYKSSEYGYIENPSLEGEGWINVECPTEDERRLLTEELHVPTDFIDYLGDEDERPRVDRDGDWTITILRIPTQTDDPDVPYITVPIGVIFHEDLILTLCFKRNDVISDFIQYTRQRRINISNRPDFILHLIYTATSWFLKCLQTINRDVIIATKDMANTVRNRELIELMQMQKTLVYFSTSLQGDEMMLEHMQRLYDGEYDTELLEDVDIEMKQALNTVAIYTQILQSTMEALGSVVSNNVNAVMKRMTAISIVLMVPTLIASFYGMNVDISLASLPGAFYMIVGLSLVLTVAVMLWLKHIKWF